jgi:hypothetical protein
MSTVHKDLYFSSPAALKTPRSPREKFTASGPGSVKEPSAPDCDPENGCCFNVSALGAAGKKSGIFARTEADYYFSRRPVRAKLHVP